MQPTERLRPYHSKATWQTTPDNLPALFDETRRRDEIVGHTSVGPHRDDIDLQINDMPVRRAASQGQCKTYTIALRLAQYEFLRLGVGMKPMLLLDDIFDKLDASRVERIWNLSPPIHSARYS